MMLLILFLLSLLCLFFGFPLSFSFFLLLRFLFLPNIRSPDQASLVLRDIDGISEAWSLSGIDEFGHFFEIGLLDPVDDWVDVEGGLVVKVALRIIIVV